jgi:hypothetical protein
MPGNGDVDRSHFDRTVHVNSDAFVRLRPQRDRSLAVILVPASASGRTIGRALGSSGRPQPRRRATEIAEYGRFALMS